MQRKNNSPKREVVWMLQWSISSSFSLAQKKTESPYSSLLGLWHSSHPMVQSISWVLPKEWLCRGKAAVPLAGLSVGLAHPSCPGCFTSCANRQLLYQPLQVLEVRLVDEPSWKNLKSSMKAAHGKKTNNSIMSYPKPWPTKIQQAVSCSKNYTDLSNWLSSWKCLDRPKCNWPRDRYCEVQWV